MAQLVPLGPDETLDPAGRSSFVGAPVMSAGATLLPLDDGVQLDKGSSPQPMSSGFGGEVGKDHAATMPTDPNAPLPVLNPDFVRGVKSFLSGGAKSLIDPMVAGALGTDADATRAANNYVKAPASAQAIFDETNRVPDERTMVPLRDPESGKYAVYYRTPEAAQGRLSAVATATAPYLATGAPPGAASALGSALAPAVPAVAGIADRLGIGTGRARAMSKIAGAVAEDAGGGGPAALDISGALVNNLGKQPLTIADVGGENVSNLLGQAMRVPGSGRQFGTTFLTNRDAGAGARLTADINEGLGGNRTAFQTAQDLTKQQKAAAAPAYEKAYAGDAYSPRVQRFIDSPRIKSGINKGIELEQLDALAEDRPFDPLSYGVDLAPDGTWVTKGTPNMRTLDAGKRGLDTMIAAERNDFGKLSPLGRSLAKVKDAYVGEIDRLNPDYAAARGAFSGPAQSMDALREGATFATMSPEELTQRLSQLTPGDRDFFRLGAEAALKKGVAQTGAAGDEARALLKNNYTKAQVRTLFGNEADFSRVMSAAENESKMARTKYGAMGNSLTQARAAQDASGSGSVLTPAVEALAAFGAHEPMLGVKAGAGAVRSIKDRLTGMTPKVADQVVRLLLDPTASSDLPGLLRTLNGPQPRPLGLLASPSPSFYPQGLLGNRQDSSAR